MRNGTGQLLDGKRLNPEKLVFRLDKKRVEIRHKFSEKITPKELELGRKQSTEENKMAVKERALGLMLENQSTNS